MADSNTSQPQQAITLTPEMLQNIISSTVQSVTNALSQQSNSSRGQRPSRPTVSEEINSKGWSHFVTKWNRYKSLSQLQQEGTANHLIECCDDELQLCLNRAVGPSLSSFSEDQLLATIKKYAVKKENTLVNRHVLTDMKQRHDKEAIHFATRLQGQAKSCDYNITCKNCNSLVSYADQAIIDQLCKGLSDQDIQQDLLTRHNKDMSLDDAVKFIEAREMAKRSHAQLFSGTQSKISPYKKATNPIRQNNSNQSKVNNSDTQDIQRLCNWCGKIGHGEKASPENRKKLCPAFGKVCNNCMKRGHFSSVCRAKSNTNSANLDIVEESESEIFFGKYISKTPLLQ